MGNPAQGKVPENIEMWATRVRDLNQALKAPPEEMEVYDQLVKLASKCAEHINQGKKIDPSVADMMDKLVRLYGDQARVVSQVETRKPVNDEVRVRIQDNFNSMQQKLEELGNGSVLAPAEPKKSCQEQLDDFQRELNDVTEAITVGYASTTKIDDPIKLSVFRQDKLQEIDSFCDKLEKEFKNDTPALATIMQANIEMQTEFKQDFDRALASQNQLRKYEVTQTFADFEDYVLIGDEPTRAKDKVQSNTTATTEKSVSFSETFNSAIKAKSAEAAEAKSSKIAEMNAPEFQGFSNAKK